MLIGTSALEKPMTESDVLDVVAESVGHLNLSGKRVLIIIPDSTRSGPVDVFYRAFNRVIAQASGEPAYLIALGTHPPMKQGAIARHLGFTLGEGEQQRPMPRVMNHHWSDPSTYAQLGIIPASEVEFISDGLLTTVLPVTVNRLIHEFDHLITCGPVFPHAVVGFSGGNKYYFPGISGPEVIDMTHWLGALITSYQIIGRKQTPVRALIDRAASMIRVPNHCLAYVANGNRLLGAYFGSPTEAWSQAADLSARVHMVYVDRTYQQVLAIMPKMYDDIWTAAKGMYKLEPVVADGGELVVYAPHIEELSYTHGRILDEIGYHVRDYYLEQWDDFKHYPWCVLAHSTHLRGVGRYHDGQEKPRIRVTLATQISQERCEHVNLGYRDPKAIDAQEWETGPDNTLVVTHAGEMLYRLAERNPTI